MTYPIALLNNLLDTKPNCTNLVPLEILLHKLLNNTKNVKNRVW